MTGLHIQSKNKTKITMLQPSQTKQSLCPVQTLTVHTVTARGPTFGAGIWIFYGNFCINTPIRHVVVMAATLALAAALPFRGSVC